MAYRVGLQGGKRGVSCGKSHTKSLRILTKEKIKLSCFNLPLIFIYKKKPPIQQPGSSR